MNTWKEVIPDYEFTEWSEENTSHIENIYLRQSLEAGKWAFASDYVRLHALYTFGGIYLDTDVEVRQRFDPFLEHDFFIGSEKNKSFKGIGTAVIGARKENALVKEMLDLYQSITFVKTDGDFDQLPNTVRIKNFLKEKGIIRVFSEDEPIRIKENSLIYPTIYFCSPSEKSYAIHHFAASWVDDYKIKKKFTFKIFGKNISILKYKIQMARKPLSDPEGGTIFLKTPISKKNGYIFTLR